MSAHSGCARAHAPSPRRQRLHRGRTPRTCRNAAVEAVSHEELLEKAGLTDATALEAKLELLYRIPHLTRIDDEWVTPGDRRRVLEEREKRAKIDELVQQTMDEAAAKAAVAAKAAADAAAAAADAAAADGDGADGAGGDE